jgi:hypothetical protein
MKLITEINEDVKYVTEAKEDGTKSLYIQGPFLQAEITNRNGRCYPATVMEKEVNRYTKELVESGRALGELGHPDSPAINLDRVSHMIVSLVREGNNWNGKAKIMNTPMGDIARGLINDGVKLGVSSRGLGSLESRNGIKYVKEDFRISTAADIVADPSAPDAFVNGVMEGVEYWYNSNGALVAEQVAERAKQDIETLARNRRLTEANKLKAFSTYLNRLTKS